MTTIPLTPETIEALYSINSYLAGDIYNKIIETRAYQLNTRASTSRLRYINEINHLRLISAKLEKLRVGKT